MPWYRTEDGQGVWHICVRGRSYGSCRAPRFETDNPAHGEVCGRMGGKLCDWKVGKDLGGRGLRCDMPLCAQHATSVGPDKDLCPKHAQLARERGHLVDGITT